MSIRENTDNVYYCYQQRYIKDVISFLTHCTNCLLLVYPIIISSTAMFLPSITFAAFLAIAANAHGDGSATLQPNDKGIGQATW